MDHGVSPKQLNVQKVQQDGSSSAYNIHVASPTEPGQYRCSKDLLNDYFLVKSGGLLYDLTLLLAYNAGQWPYSTPLSVEVCKGGQDFCEKWQTREKLKDYFVEWQTNGRY